MKALLCKLEDLLESVGVKRKIVFLVIGGVSLLLSLLDKRFNLFPLPVDVAWIAIVLCGVPIILEAVIGLFTRFDIRADVLVSLALIASVFIGEEFAAGEIACIMQLGSLLEELTVAKARAGIEDLVRLTPQAARVIRDGRQSFLSLDEVRVGDLIRILPGETVPVDGVILSGQTSVSQAIMTGEALPVDKGPGDEVFSGTVNQFGAFDMEASRVGEDSSLQRMIRLVQSADADKAKIVSLADRWATWIVATALVSAAVTWLVSGQIIRAVTILVVFCPCALVLATPTAVMAAIGNAARHGFLVREGDALERLAGVNAITFDKTGTLTNGDLRVAAVKPALSFSGRELLRLAACAEKLSEHPLGKAVVKCCEEEVPSPDEFRMLPGRGVLACSGGRKILAGSKKLLEENGVAVPVDGESVGRGGTVIYVAVDGSFAGVIALSDTVRSRSAETIGAVRSMGILPVLLTGDNAEAAETVAGALGIGDVCSGCLPEHKLERIRQMQSKGSRVCMIGDGINDAPALKAADVSIAMGSIGSDIAVNAADITLVDDDIRELPHLLALSRRMMNTIRVNLTFSMALNFLSVALAVTGLLNPVSGALVHNAGSVLVIVCSALLLNWRRRPAAPVDAGSGINRVRLRPEEEAD